MFSLDPGPFQSQPARGRGRDYFRAHIINLEAGSGSVGYIYSASCNLPH